jgi:NTE family protein
MRAVAFVTKLIDEGRLADGKRMLIHVIEAEDVIRELPGSSRLNNDWGFLCHLHEVGRARAEKCWQLTSITSAKNRRSISKQNIFDH